MWSLPRGDLGHITDVSPLVRLPNLTTLNLYENRIVDVAPLAKLTNLTTLNLRDNKIKDVTPLKELPKLETLWLSGNPISADQKAMLRKALPNCRIEF